MISRRNKLLNLPWEQLRYEQHKEKVRSAKPTVDVRSPRSYPHVNVKPKKAQKEKDRMTEIEKENCRLLQKLGDIMRAKRLPNFWMEPRPNFLSREKLFETRRQSSSSKLITIYAPPEPTSVSMKSSPTSKTARRCPTCCGKPELSEMCIPESRIPWAPPRKSWSTKSSEICVPKRCLHCGHPKLKERNY